MGAITLCVATAQFTGAVAISSNSNSNNSNNYNRVLRNIIQPKALKASTLELPVDHFNKIRLTSDTWKMRYWFDDSHVKKTSSGR